MKKNCVTNTENLTIFCQSLLLVSLLVAVGCATDKGSGATNTTDTVADGAGGTDNDALIGDSMGTDQDANADTTDKSDAPMTDAKIEDGVDGSDGTETGDAKGDAKDGSETTTGDVDSSGGGDGSGGGDAVVLMCGGKACDDGNVCTTESCNQGACLHTPNDIACTDGNACTDGDHCTAGTCKPGATLNCDDKDSCTKDSCDPASGCKIAAAGVDCDDKNVCTDDSCTNSACLHLPNDAVCTDGSVCTDGDHCDKSACSPGKALACDDADPCTADSCDAVKGCVHTGSSGGTCNDGNPCTTNDVCKTGKCVGDACDVNAACAGVSGCVCNEGYSGDGYKCTFVPLTVAMTVSAGSLSPTFTQDTKNYTDDVGNSVTSISFTVTVPTGTSVKLSDGTKETKLTSGTASPAQNLVVGLNEFIISVTLGTQSSIYVIDVTRAGP